jgi:hypothetical protein
MKAQLTFDLSDIDDNYEFERHVKSADMAAALWEIATNMQKSCRWHQDENPNEDMVEFVFKQIYDTLDEYGIDVEKLYR